MNKDQQVCTIGGGTGMPVVNQALITAGFNNIASIVTTFDSGGDTGRLRTNERGELLAFSDYWRSLISLWPNGKQKEIWAKMLRYRDGRDRNFGNAFFRFMAERTGNLSEVDNLFSRLTGAKLAGKVVPVALEPADIEFKTASGRVYHGEHMLDEYRMARDRVVKAWLEPEITANPEALKVLKEADLIIFCPGSVHGSVLANFLPTGMKEVYQKSQAEKILFTNIMSTANESHGFDQNNYVELFSQYLGDDPVDLVVMPDFNALDEKKLEEVLELYQSENSFPIYPTEESSYNTVVADIIMIEGKNKRLRHSEEKLAKFFEEKL